MGAGVGWGITYAVLRLGKLLFGKQRLKLDPDTEVVFTESGVRIGEDETSYEDIFYRASDEIRLKAKQVRAMEKTWENAEVRLSQSRLLIGEEAFDPDQVTELRVITDGLELPRRRWGLAT